MKHPKFILIGAPRSGTSSVWEALKQHPEIYCSPLKEPWFFALEGLDAEFSGPGDHQGIRAKSRYDLLFSSADANQISGEASTLYLYSHTAATNIQKHVPDVKLIAILRDPAERAASNYMQHLLNERETIMSFESALAVESDRRKRGWSLFWFYKAMGFYGEQLKRYYDRFPSSKIKVFTFDELREDFLATIGDIMGFLGVSEFRPRLITQENVSGLPKNDILQKLIDANNLPKHIIRSIIGKRASHFLAMRIRNANLRKPAIAEQTISQLRHEYAADLLLVQKLTGLNLSNWIP